MSAGENSVPAIVKDWHLFPLTPTAALQTLGELRETGAQQANQLHEWLEAGGKMFLRVFCLKCERATEWAKRSLNHTA